MFVPLYLLSQLESVSIQANVMVVLQYATATLREVHLVNCSQLDSSWVRDTLEKFLTVQKISIKDCEGIDE